MTHLLELTLGPVQGFINAARRTRDLWAGSWMLSELARAAGAALLENKANLIYPVPRRISDPAPDETGNLSNILLAQVETDDEDAVRALAEEAKKAARKKLADMADTAWKDWNQGGVQLREAIWDRQIIDALEIHVAWARVEGDDYETAYKHLKKTLSARKNTRDFGPMFPPGSNVATTGIPKSSLDGLRESVLPETRDKLHRKFGLSPNEQLDALGCIKRHCGLKDSFTPLPRLAAHGWLQKLKSEKREVLAAAYEPLVGQDLATRVKGNAGHYRDFPYDAGLLFPERLEIATWELKGAPDADALADMQQAVQPLWQVYGRPNPYAALVVADGDRMGAFIAKAANKDTHTRISSAIAEFADAVPGIAREFGGHAIYAGGEDLTVLFPLAGLIEAAQKLAETFAAKLAPLADELKVAADERPTLRVGAAICHVLEPFSVIRERAAAAEKFAKSKSGAGQGHALGLRLHIRSGGVVEARLPFADTEAFAALHDWQCAYQNKLVPGRLAYDMRDIVYRNRAIRAGAEVAIAEFTRLIHRAQVSGGDKNIPPEIRAALQQRRQQLAASHNENDPAGLSRLADELILARWLAANTSAEIDATGGTR